MSEEEFINNVERHITSLKNLDNKALKILVGKLEQENKKLNIKVASLEWEIKWLNYVIDKLREELSAYDREYFDEDKKAKNIFIEEDTLQELRDLCKI